MSLRKWLMKNQRGKCHYCQKQMTLKTTGKYHVTEDHILPKSRGGGNSVGNLIGACFTCNNMRGNIPYKAFKFYIELHGNEDPISKVLRNLTRAQYERHRDIYDAVRGYHFQSHLPIEIRDPLPEFKPKVDSLPLAVPNKPYRREFLHLTRRNIQSIVIGIPNKKKQILLAETGTPELKESEECQSPKIPSPSFLTTTMLKSPLRIRKTASTW